MRQLYFINFSLYTTISIYTFLIYYAMPAVMAKEGIAPNEIGIIYLTSLPFSLGFFYTPLVEGFRKSAEQNFKILTLSCAFSAVFLLLIIAFIPPIEVMVLTVLFMIMCFFGASALISLNAISIEQTTTKSKVTINTIMLFASGIGGIFGIVLTLAIVSYFGFSMACLVMAGFIALISLPLIFISASGNYGNVIDKNIAHYTKAQLAIAKGSVLTTLKTPHLYAKLLFLCLLISPMTIYVSTNSMLLVYLGFDLAVVGILSGALNCLAMLFVAPVVYGLIRAIGFRMALLATLLIECAVFLLMIIDLCVWENHLVLVLLGGAIGCCFGAHFVFMYGLGMRWCESSKQSGVDFSFLRSAENISFMLFGVVATSILGLFIQSDDIKSVVSADSGGALALHNGNILGAFISILRRILYQSDIESSIAQGYSAIYTIALLLVIVSLIALWRIKAIK